MSYDDAVYQCILTILCIVVPFLSAGRLFGVKSVLIDDARSLFLFRWWPTLSLYFESRENSCVVER